MAKLSLKSFYGGDVPEAIAPRPQPGQPTQTERQGLLTPAQRQTVVDVLATARMVKRLSAGIQVTPGQLGLVAAAAVAAFGGYKWYTSRRKNKGLSRKVAQR